MDAARQNCVLLLPGSSAASHDDRRHWPPMSERQLAVVAKIRSKRWTLTGTYVVTERNIDTNLMKLVF
jgi:hypothetical protein